MSDTYLGPEGSRRLAYLILSNRKDSPLDAYGAAFVFGGDRNALREAYDEHLDQSEAWAKAALDALHAGEPDSAVACRHEARAWAGHANLLKEATALCAARELAPVDWPLAEHVLGYHEASAQRWHVFHVVREKLGLAVEIPECCADDDCGCGTSWMQCTVCGEYRVAQPDPPGLDLSAVENDDEVVAAVRREDHLRDELYAAFDDAVAHWRRGLDAQDGGR